MNIPGHSPPQASFEVPLEMLSACHGRIEHQCATLERLARHLERHGPDDQARTAAAAVIRYFETAAPLHHADEEVDLFPALIESMAGSDAVCLRALSEGLAGEHRQIEVMWRRLHPALALVVDGTSTGAKLDAGDVEAFTAAYRQHIEREESELIPMAARLLTDDALAQVGRAMRERRGIAPVR
ncbi:MAG: hemerythrin domain-containing protein [Variovorax sp.]